MSAHTKASWLIAEDDDSFVYALGPGGTNLFWTQVQAAGPEKVDAAEKAANARLIAAAPDLLEALVACSTADGNEAYSSACRLARVAIAKATGAA